MSQFKKDEVRESIERTALDLFFRRGYMNTKIRDICVESKTSVGNLYRYFSNKKEIFDSLITQEFYDVLKNHLIKRTNILHKMQFDIPINTEEKIWYEKDYFNFLVSNRKNLVILYLYRKETGNEKQIDEIIQYMMEEKRRILQSAGLANTPQEYMETVVMAIRSTIDLNIEILAKEKAAAETITLLRNIDYYHLKGISALWSKMGEQHEI